MDPTAIVEFLLKIVDKLPRGLRTTILILVAGAALLYLLAVATLTGANAMQWNVPRVAFLAFCAAAGLGIGQFAWTQVNRGGTAPSPMPGTLPTPAAPASASSSIVQSTTGAQSPTVVGTANIIYNNAPAGPSPAEMKYRGQLADEISASRHSLDKSRNRWYTFSVQGNRPEAGKYWKEAETRMGASAALLRAKVNKTAETEFLQIQAGEPVAHPNLRDPKLPDGAAISEMWNRVTRLTKIEQRVRNGTEPIVYPPPSP